MSLLKWLKTLFTKKQVIEKPVETALPAARNEERSETPTLQWVADLIVAEAQKWVGVRESGANKGKEVEMFQKAVDGKAQGEAWCMAFVQYVVRVVFKQLQQLSHIPAAVFLPLHASEHCLTVWNNTPTKYRSKVGGRGMVPIWRHGTTSSGHTGVSKDAGVTYFNTIEGNTNSAGSREGDGVYDKKRLMVGGTMTLVGFIDVPQMLLDLMADDAIIYKK